MVISCSAYGCVNRYAKNDNKDRIKFHRFPLKDPHLLKQWMVAVRSDSWKPTAVSFLCSDHFTDEDYKPPKKCYLKKDAVPSVFNFSEHLQKTAKKQELIVKSATPPFAMSNRCSPVSCNTNLQPCSSDQPELMSGLQRFAVEKYVEQLISTPNYLEYLIETPGYLSPEYKCEYDRFLDYVEKCSEPGKSQLTELLFPLFVHLYLLMLRLYPNHNDTESSVFSPHVFYEEFSSLFLDETEGYETYLERLFNLKSIKDVENDPYFKEFWAQKYFAKVSIDVIQSLKSFLVKIKSKALQFVFHFHFHFEEMDLPVQGKDFESNLNFNSNDRLRNEDINKTESEVSKEQISKVVLPYNISCFTSSDVNKEETKISIAHNSCILTANLKDFSHEEIKLPGVSAVKYTKSVSDTIVAAYGSDVKLITFGEAEGEIRYKTHHTKKIWDIDVNSSGTLFASVSRDTTACIWNLNEKIPFRRFCSHTDDVTAVNFHPNDYYFATGSSDKKVLLFSVDDTCPVQCCEGLKSKVTSIKFSPNGKMLAASDLGAVKIWTLEDNKLIFHWPELEASSSSICFDDSSNKFALINTTGSLRIFDLRNKKELVDKNLKKFPLFMNFSHGDQVWKIILKGNL